MKQIIKYIKSDFYRHKGRVRSFGFLFLYACFGRNHSFSYSFWLRLASRKSIFYPLAVVIHNHLSVKYGVYIPKETKIGYGFFIGHCSGIIINGNTVIGNNCNISQFLTIGSNHGTPAVIGDNVYIGPSVCLVEDVVIGDEVTIGAGAVVVKSVPPHATVVGVPAKAVNMDKPGRYVLNRYNSVQSEV